MYIEIRRKTLFCILPRQIIPYMGTTGGAKQNKQNTEQSVTATDNVQINMNKICSHDIENVLSRSRASND